MTNTKILLLNELSKSYNNSHCDWYLKAIEAIANVELPDLKDGREYSVTWKLNGVTVITNREIWDEKLRCYIFADEEILMTLKF
jgi:hypothetical protein